MTAIIKDEWHVKAIVTLLLSAAASAAAYPSMIKWCYQCVKATQYVLPYADRVGLVFYIALALAFWRFKINKLTLAGLYGAAGVHVALLAKLISLHLFCAPCALCAACVALACLLTMERSTRFVTVAVLGGIATTVVTSFAYQKLEQSTEQKRTREAIKFNQLDLSAAKSLPIYVFEEPSCHTCREFGDLYTPRLLSKYGNKISIVTMPAPGSIYVPTIVIGGSDPTVIIHKPDWFDLTTAIERRIPLSKNDVAENKTEVLQ